MFKTCLIVCVLLIAQTLAIDASVNTVSQQTTCSVSAIDNILRTRYIPFLARFDNFADESVPGELEAVGRDIFGVLAPCVNLGASFVAQEAVEQIKFVTRECPYAKTELVYQNDACCNNTLRFSTCCVGREVSVPRKIISKFKPEIRTACNEPGKVMSLMRHFNRRYEAREAFCSAISVKRLQLVFLGFKSMEKCFSELLNGRSCASHSDCVSGVCLPTTQTCAVSPIDLPPASVAKCFIKSLPKHLTRSMQIYLGITKPDVSETDLSDAIVNRVFNDGCLTAQGGATSGFNNKTSCEAPKICADGAVSTSCNTASSFCGCFCNNNNVCHHPLTVVQDQNFCNAIGMCQGIDNAGQAVAPIFVNQSVCESVSMCTASSCYPNCDAAKCATSGFCAGYPIFQDTCVKPHVFDENGAPGCSSGERNFEFGCIVPNVQQAACSSMGGTWTPFPKTKADCEKYEMCQEFDRITLKKPEECNKCSGVVLKPYTWIGGQWRPRYFTKPCSWIQRSVVQVNKWVKVIDFTKFIQFVFVALRSEFYSILRSTIVCHLDPLAKALRFVACSCGTDKQSNCFANQLDSNIGNLRLFANASAHHSLGDATIEISNDAIASNGDNVQVTITKKDVVVASESETLSRRAALQTAKRTVYVTDYKNNIGQLVGDGIGLSSAPGGTVKLCIKRTEEMTLVSDASFTKGGFAIEDGSGSYILSDVPIVKTDSIEVCGMVSKGATTYYPCMVKADAAPNPTKPKVVSGTTRVEQVSLFVIMATLFLSLLAIL